MQNQEPLDPESASVQTHLKMMQDVTARMAENSRSCKLWCVTLVAATLVLVARTGEPQHALIALVPAVALLILDAYYLALERAFRNSYNDFVGRLHGNSLATGELYALRPTGRRLRLALTSLYSASILLFYPFVAGTILVAWRVILPIN